MTSPQTTAVATVAAVDLVAHAQALQSVLADLGTVTVQQVVTLFRKYAGITDFPALLKQALPEIVTPHAEAAAHITAQWYDELNPSSTFEATPVVDLAPERFNKTADWALYAPGDAKPEERLAGSTKRMVSDASRDTVLSNVREEGVLWARYASANACAFCRMVATRGAVYRTELSASRVTGQAVNLTVADRRMRAAGLVNTTDLLNRRDRYAKGAKKGQDKVRQLRGSQKQGEKYHDHCRCIAVPVRGGDYEPPDYVHQWEQDYVAAVKATKAEKKTKGEYGAIDFKAVLAQMRSKTEAS